MSAANTDVAIRAIEAVERLSDAAVRSVTDEIYRRHAQALVLRGSRGRTHTERDLKYHIEFLSGALAVGDPVFFTDYARWLAAVLERRNVPVHVLDESMELLSRFFERSLDPTLAGCITTLLAQGRRSIAERRSAPHVFRCAHRPPDLPQVPEFARCLVDGDVRAARLLAQEAWEASGDYVEVATRLLQPALYDVGTWWERNEITVAQEHLATAICETLLTQYFLTAALFGAPIGKTAVFAAVEGSQHALGLRMVSDAFELAGWFVQYLGANTPTEALIAHVDSAKPQLIGLSASMVQHLPRMQHAIQALRAELGSRCPVLLVGGLPTNQCSDIWRRMGADAWSPDARQAVADMT